MKFGVKPRTPIVARAAAVPHVPHGPRQTHYYPTPNTFLRSFHNSLQVWRKATINKSGRDQDFAKPLPDLSFRGNLQREHRQRL